MVAVISLIIIWVVIVGVMLVNFGERISTEESNMIRDRIFQQESREK